MRHGTIAAVMMLPGLAAVTQAEEAARDSRAWIGDLRQHVQACWNPPEGSGVATVTFEMNRDGTIIDDSLRSIPREMSDTDSFMAARHAILRCGRTGFDLPADQYDVWREIEMTFDPAVEGEQ